MLNDTENNVVLFTHLFSLNSYWPLSMFIFDFFILSLIPNLAFSISYLGDPKVAQDFCFESY